MAVLGVQVQYSDGKLYVTFNKVQVGEDRSVFLKVQIDPGSHEHLRTRSINTRTQDIFGETFTFFIAKERVGQKVLTAELWGYNHTGEEQLGSAQLSLVNIDLTRTLQTNLELRMSQEIIFPAQQENMDIFAIAEEREDGKGTDSDTSFSSDSDCSSIEVSEKSTKADMNSLNRRLQQVFSINKSAEVENTNMNLNTEMQMASKEFIELNSLLASLHSQIQEEEKETQRLQAKINLTNTRIETRLQTLAGQEERQEDYDRACADLKDRIRAKTVEASGKEARLEEQKLELVRLEDQLVEKVARFQTEQTFSRWREGLEDVAAGGWFNQDPRVFSHLMEAEVKRLGESIDVLNNRVLGNYRDFAERHQHLLDQQKSTDEDLQEDTVEEGRVLEALRTLYAERVHLRMETRELEADIKLLNNLHSIKLQAVAEAKEYLLQEFDQLSRNLSSSLPFQEEEDRAGYSRILETNLSSLQKIEAIDELNTILSAIRE